jgi:hypothetical protein
MENHIADLKMVTSNEMPPMYLPRGASIIAGLVTADTGNQPENQTLKEVISNSDRSTSAKTFS